MNEYTNFYEYPEASSQNRWDRTMFRMAEPSPRFPSLQDYFREPSEETFLLFLHHYEDRLNQLTQRATVKYGLSGQFADVKMVYVETLFKLWKAYDPSNGKNFLEHIDAKLARAVREYAMADMKGFSACPSQYSVYCGLRKAAAVYKANRATHTYEETLHIVRQAIGIQEKTADKLLREMWTLDTFLWYDDILEGQDDADIPPGQDILFYSPQLLPEDEVLRDDTYRLITEAYDELTEKEQDVLAMHMGFCPNCLRPQPSKTYDEIADVYQFGTENGVSRFYQRTLDKLRIILDRKGLFFSVRLKRIRRTSSELIYYYIPMDCGEPGILRFHVQNHVVQTSYIITQTAELDYVKSQELGHASARLLLRLAKEGNLPADRVFPLPSSWISKEHWAGKLLEY